MNERYAGLYTRGAVLAALIASGCSTTQPSNFYMLRSLPTQAMSTLDVAGTPTIAVTLLRFPEYLNRSQIVRRASGNAVVLSESDRWAEPLRENFSRVLLENISTLVGTPAVIAGPPRHNELIDNSILIEVSQFDLEQDNTVRLIARWSIVDRKNKPLAPIRKSVFSVPIQDPSYDAIAAAHSQAVADFSEEIADAFKNLAPK